jgi:double-strand break repair protein AddB
MFEGRKTPRVFAEPPGVDFAQGLVDGLTDHAKDFAPHDWAHMEIYVNTARMQRRIRDVFDAGPARLLPRIRLITDLATDPVSVDIKPPVSALRRRLELSQFVAKLLDQEPDLAPRTALYDLSDSLASLMDEMQGEGVSPEKIVTLDISDQSGHWERALKFLRIIAPFFADETTDPDKEVRQRAVITARAAQWAVNPPNHPIIIAGSTGSRGTTALLMQAVAELPNGAVILPGYDFGMPDDVWETLADEDHPQFRFKRLMQIIGFGSTDVTRWSDRQPADAERNRLISLSLRPAPVTNQWREEGPNLGNLITATEKLTLVEAATPRAEAETIALRLRQAVEDGITAALISPDRMLTRQVTAALDRWDITPDDSAGTPLALSPPGRMLRHVAAMRSEVVTAEAILTILKHPLCHSDRDDRGAHLLHTRELELELRRNGPPFPTAQTFVDWAGDNANRKPWAAWLAQICASQDVGGELHLTAHLQSHLQLAEQICAGPDATGSGGLWAEGAGRAAQRICDNLRQDADAGGLMNTRDYAALFGAVLADGVVRDRDTGHPGVLIWGTLEARVHGVDLTILGGMNDGTWPEAPPPDPWLNRKMRADAGLLLPERRIGLSAHDYQQAVAGDEVWITRSKRSADAETVPSRWINRLTNLLGGLPSGKGPEALSAMRTRGDHWLSVAEKLSSPTGRTTPAKRPSPQPPLAARPDRFSVTQIKTLIRDPYAIYARKTLRLDPLDPLAPTANAPLRGIIIHGILEQFIKEGGGPSDRDRLMEISHTHFADRCPWPTIRAQWIARMDRAADIFLADEANRQATADMRKTEVSGKISLPNLNVTLTCTADRFDITPDDHVLIYDYKTGQVPTAAQQEMFDKQLLLEAAMVERGAFGALGHKQVDGASFIGVNAAMKVVPAPLGKQPPDVVWEELQTLFGNWQKPARGYTARLALFLKSDISPYDHLSRYGEWETSDDAVPEVLT